MYIYNIKFFIKKEMRSILEISLFLIKLCLKGKGNYQCIKNITLLYLKQNIQLSPFCLFSIVVCACSGINRCLVDSTVIIVVGHLVSEMQKSIMLNEYMTEERSNNDETVEQWTY